MKPQQISEAFADYFCGLFSGDGQGPLYSSSSGLQMGAVEVSYDRVRELLESLDPGSSMGPDAIHPQVLKSCSSLLAYPLWLVFSSLLSRTVPSEWKLAFLAPLFKKGIRHDYLNYRPVSLTSGCCKTLERVVHGEMVKF